MFLFLSLCVFFPRIFGGGERGKGLKAHALRRFSLDPNFGAACVQKPYRPNDAWSVVPGLHSRCAGRSSHLWPLGGAPSPLSCEGSPGMGLGSAVQTENRWYPRRQEANIKPSILCILRKKAFLFRFTPDSLEMCLEATCATIPITVAFYSLTKCFPRIPAQLPFVSSLSYYSGWMCEKQSSKVRNPLSLPQWLVFLDIQKQMEWVALPPKYIVVCVVYVYILLMYTFAQRKETY